MPFLESIVSRCRSWCAPQGSRPPVTPEQVRQASLALARQTRLHLGCGGNVLSGWANVDLEGSHPVIEWDLTRPLPVHKGSFDYIYSEHFIEHIRFQEAKALLRDCHRLLKPGGRIRLSTPDLEKLVSEFQAGRVSEWADMEWTPATPCQMLNEGMRLWGHQFLYDFTELHAILTEAGFKDIERQAWRVSRHPPLEQLESRPFHDELIIEATT